MKNIVLNLLTGLILTTNVFANSSMNSAIEEYLYITDVEGKSSQLAATEFKSRLNATGLSQKEQLEGVVANIKDQELKASLNNVLATVDAQKLTPEQTQDMIMEALKGHSAKGASWAGETELIIWGIALVALLTWMVIAASGPEQVCVETAVGEYLDVRGDKYFTEYGEHCVRWEDKPKAQN